MQVGAAPTASAVRPRGGHQRPAAASGARPGAPGSRVGVEATVTKHCPVSGARLDSRVRGRAGVRHRVRALSGQASEAADAARPCSRAHGRARAVQTVCNRPAGGDLGRAAGARGDRGRAAGTHRRRVAGVGTVSGHTAVSETLVGPGRVKVRAMRAVMRGATVGNPLFMVLLLLL